MSARIGKKTVCLVTGLFAILAFSTLSWGETDFGRLLSIQNKRQLKKIARKVEKVIEKNPKDIDSLITLGIVYHNLGDIGVRTAPEESVKHLKEAKKLDANNAFVLSLLGSSTTMLGRYSKNKVTDGRMLVGKGGDLLDRAVMKSPDDARVRIIRAHNSLGLPKFFGRRHYFKTDLLHIEGLINKSPSGYDKNFKALVYFKLGEAFKLEEDDSTAKTYFKKAMEVAPDSPFAKEAQKEL